MIDDRAEIDEAYARAFARAPAFRDDLERSVAALSALVLLVVLAVVILIGLGAAWLFGWVDPLGGVVSTILALLAMAWTITFVAALGRWRACQGAIDEIEAMRGNVVDTAVQLNARFAARHREGREPFVLYLRSFYTEVATGAGRTVGDPAVGRSISLHRPVEEGLATALEGRIAAWACTSPPAPNG